MQQALQRAANMLMRPAGALDDPLNALRVFTIASVVDVPQAEEAAHANLRASSDKNLTSRTEQSTCGEPPPERGATAPTNASSDTRRYLSKRRTCSMAAGI